MRPIMGICENMIFYRSKSIRQILTFFGIFIDFLPCLSAPHSVFWGLFLRAELFGGWKSAFCKSYIPDSFYRLSSYKNIFLVRRLSSDPKMLFFLRCITKSLRRVILTCIMFQVQSKPRASRVFCAALFFDEKTVKNSV